MRAREKKTAALVIAVVGAAKGHAMLRKVTLTVAAAALVVLGGCSSGADEADSEPRLAFGLEMTDVEEAVDRYAPEADPVQIAAQLAAPFDCSRFGDTCARLGAEQTELLLEEVWELARSGAEPEALTLAVDETFAHAEAPTLALRSTAIPAFGSTATETTWAVCPLGLNLEVLDVTVYGSDLGLLAHGEVSYESTRQSLLAPIPIALANPVDADLSVTIHNGAGSFVASANGSTVAESDGLLSLTTFSSAISHEIAGEVDAGGCLAAGTHVDVGGFLFPFP